MTHIDVPQARLTAPHGINNRDQVVGEYQDSAGRVRGFLWTNGRYTTFGMPGAVSTQPADINNYGQIVVSSLASTPDDPYAGARGFVLRDGTRGPFTEVRFPGAPKTLASGINNQGSVIGAYENPNAAATGQRNPRAARRPLDTLPLAPAKIRTR